jgi:protein ImuB
MSLAQARALVRERVIVVPWKPESDADALRSVATWCHRFSPIVGIDPPDGLVMDVTGTQRLHKGEHRLLALIRRSMDRFGFRTRLAIASTVGCARAASRHGDITCMSIQPGDEAACMRAMPIEALDLSNEQTASLRALGFDRVGPLMELPRSSLSARFGADALKCIDAALGRRTEVIVPVRPREVLQADHVLDGPTSHWESVHRCAGMLVAKLMALLSSRQMGLRRLDVTLALANGSSPVRITLTLCRPCRDERHVWSMLQPHLERADLGDGVESISLVAARASPIHHSQYRLNASPGLDSPGDGDRPDSEAAIGMLSDTLMSRLGADAVMKMFPVESHVPERSFRLESMATARRRHDAARVDPTPRPTRLFMRPEPIHVIHLSPDGPIFQLQWRHTTWSVTSCIGPERIGGRWWLSTPTETCIDRDYYRVCITARGHEPRWIWMYRLSVHGTWHAHGEWA